MEKEESYWGDSWHKMYNRFKETDKPRIAKHGGWWNVFYYKHPYDKYIIGGSMNRSSAFTNLKSAIDFCKFLSGPEINPYI